MAVRTFTRPSSLNESLATATIKMSGADANAPPRSEASAKDSTQSFPSEARNPLSHSTNPNSKPGITFAHQEKLPKLPIPELESSCTKYLAALKPLQSPKEHHDTELAVHDFLKQDGQNLQEKLKKYAAGKANYIEQFCELFPSPTLAHSRPLAKYQIAMIQISHVATYHTVLFACANYLTGYDSYLNFDNPVVLNLNPFFLLEDDPTPARNNQVTRAASLVVSALSFVRAVRKEEDRKSVV